jgi:hypothetical protein
MKEFQIFIDLDDTLIYSMWNPTSKRYTSTKKFGERYGSVTRPIAYELLEFAKTIDPNPKMITTAAREWAEHWNEVFEFGFDTIYSREDFTQTTTRVYGGEAVENTGDCLNVERGCIIDNYHWDDPSPIHKMNFTFGEVRQESWIHLAPFTGHTNVDFKLADQKRFERMKQEINELCMK